MTKPFSRQKRNHDPVRAFHFLELQKLAFSYFDFRRWAALLADSRMDLLIDLHTEPRTDPPDLTAPALWADKLPELVTTSVAWVLSLAAFAIGERAGHERNRAEGQSAACDRGYRPSSDVCGVRHDRERHKISGLKPWIPRAWTLAGSLLLAQIALASSEPLTPSHAALLPTYSTVGTVPVKSWKALRDDRIVKQDLDYSCGAASLATLLGSFYGRNVTEEALLKAMDKGDGRASFDDMARALGQFGFRAQGFAASWEQLTHLKIPVIVYVKHRKNDHFSVLRGINKDTVWLADPSLGNRTFNRAQFLAMWQTRAHADDGLAGKFLAVLPASAGEPARDDFFTRTPVRQSASALASLAAQGWRP
jgi:predicted double-glycine peptidase